MQFHCCDRDQDFVHEQALHQQLADKLHKSRSIPQVSSLRLSIWVCEPCEREFSDEKGLEQHRMSVAHRPFSNIKCIGDRRCKKKFTSPSALLHHLESGGCPSKMTREKLHSAVQSSDLNRLITGGSIQEYTALMGPDMSETTSITESIIFTPNTDDRFSWFRSQPGIWEFQSGIITSNSGMSQSLSEDLSRNEINDTTTILVLSGSHRTGIMNNKLLPPPVPMTATTGLFSCRMARIASS